MDAALRPILTPSDVERASRRADKRYELVDGALVEKRVGARSLFVAGRIAGRLNDHLYPDHGVAVVGGAIYCFQRSDHGRRPDVAYVRLGRLPGGAIPKGDLLVPPDLVAEVLGPDVTATDLAARLEEYLGAGIPLVWIVNPDARTIRVYRDDGTTRLYRAADAIEGEPLLPGFRLAVGEVFPAG